MLPYLAAVYKGSQRSEIPTVEPLTALASRYLPPLSFSTTGVRAPSQAGRDGGPARIAWTDQHGPPNERPNQPSDGGLQRTPGLSGSGRGRLGVRSRLGGGCRGLLQRYVQQSARHGARDTGGEIKRTGVQKTDLVSVSWGAGRMLGQDTGQGRMCWVLSACVFMCIFYFSS